MHFIPHQPQHICVATLGGQPQVVTLALDALYAQGIPIREVLILHLSQQNPRYQAALDCLAREFVDDTYAGHHCRYRPMPVYPDAVFDDLKSEAAIDTALSTFHRLIQQLKQQDATVHLCIAGGRRLLGMLLVSAALLYFDQSDRIWHLYSTEEVRHQTHEGTVLHLPGHPGVRLVCIRVPPWGHFFPALRPTTESARPDTVLGLQTSMRDAEERARCQQVCDRLTPRQRDVLRAFAAGGTLQEVSRELSITVATVHTHKTHIFQECCAAWNLPPGTRLDYRWLRDTFAAYFSG